MTIYLVLKTEPKKNIAESTGRITSSVLLCTKNRTNEVVEFLSSLAKQTQKPDEVLVIDGANNSKLKALVSEFEKDFSSLKYMTVNGDLTAARNKGIKNFKSEVAFFLDDDLVLDKEFFTEILSVFENDQEKKIGGVCGTISNHSRQKGFRKLLTNLFFLPGDGDGSFRLSGAATWAYGLPNKMRVSFLPGGLTAYRRDVFASNLFDEALPLFGFTDDVDFSYRVSQKFTNIYNPNAKALHSRPSSTRAMDFNILKLWIWAYWRTYFRNRKWNIFGYIPLLLLSFGFVLKYSESNLKAIFGQKVPVTS